MREEQKIEDPKIEEPKLGEQIKDEGKIIGEFKISVQEPSKKDD